MDMNTKLIIKVQLDDEIRKMPIHNEDITYDELIIMMERVFKHKLSAEDEMIIKYKDEDNDLITISDDSDLAFAIESSNVLKLSLTVEKHNAKQESLSQITDSNFEEVVRKELQLIRDHATRLLDKLVHTNNGETGSNNPILSGRTSAVGGGRELQEFVGGKEFDPLSSGNISQYQVIERAETSTSVTNSQENGGKISDHFKQINPDSNTHEISRQPESFNKNPLSVHSNVYGQTQNQSSRTVPLNVPYSIGNSNVSGSAVTGSSFPNFVTQNKPLGAPQNLPPTMGGQGKHQNMSSTMSHHVGDSNVPPPVMGNSSIPQNVGGINMCANVGVPPIPQNMSGSNMHQNLSQKPPGAAPVMPPNIGGPHMSLPPPSNMVPQSVPSNLGMPNMNIPNQGPASAVTGGPKGLEMHSSLPNAPTFAGNTTTSGFNMVQPMSTMRSFYAAPMQPPRMSSSNFQGPGNVGNNPNMATRPPSSYFNPQGAGSPQFGLNVSHPNPNYGYQPLQK